MKPEAKKRKPWIQWGAAAAAVVLITAMAIAQRGAAPPAPPAEQKTEQTAPQPAESERDVQAADETNSAEQRDETGETFLVTKAEYPAMVKITDGEEAWSQDRWERWEQRAQYELPPGALDGFLTAALPALLADTDGGNRVCSPINVYMALAMVAELSGGESRAQLLRLLDVDSIEALEERADRLWNANYRDDGKAVSILAASLWMRDDRPCLKGTVQTLRDVFHASSFRGDMNDPRYTAALRSWLNGQTGGQLQSAAENVTLDPQTVLELVTTVYFRAKWLEPFDEANTYPETFHAPDGDVACDFLHDACADFWAYRGARFTAVQQSFEGAGDIWFLLPDEGVTPEALLADPEAAAFLRSGNAEQAEWYYGRLALPKLDVVSELELSDALKALGVVDVFDAERADLSPLFEDAEGIALSHVQHAARLAMDERGVTATAFTAMGYGAGGPEYAMDFTLDRPFLFKINGDGNTPLFAGIVNRP